MTSNLPALRNSGLDVVTSNGQLPPIAHKLDKHVFQHDKDAAARDIARFAGRNSDEKAVLTAHKALEEGRAVVDITRVLAQNHFSETQWPQFGIARLTDRVVYCCRWYNGTVRFIRRTGRLFPKPEIFFELPNMSWASVGLHDSKGDRWRQRQSGVPVLPSDLREKYDPANPSYRVLWEAVWDSETRDKKPPPPRFDPALLEHVAGSLYAVVAVWDLSPVEISALGPSVG